MLGGFEPDRVLVTGDKEIDDIERRLAAGEDPDEVLKGWGDGEAAVTEDSDGEDIVDDDFSADMVR